MKSVKTITVTYHDQTVGRMALTPANLCAFEYDKSWLLNGFSISPFYLPLEKRVFIADREPFNGNFGVFDDSLPDGWGRLLVDRMLLKHGIAPQTVSILDRLSIVGKSGMGALEYYPETLTSSDNTPYDLDELSAECEQILNEHSVRDLEQLLSLGGASGGARPKVLIRHNDADWIVKFRSSYDPVNIGIQEYKYSILAKKAGIIMPETKLFNDKYFGIKRFDRIPHKIHMISACGLLNSSHRYPALDYVDLIKTTLALTRSYEEAEKLFRLMCFNYFIHNRDDHSKNFSFLYINDQWILAPGYDLTPSKGLVREHSTTINGEGKNPTENDLLQTGFKCGISHSKCKTILDNVKSVFKG